MTGRGRKGQSKKKDKASSIVDRVAIDVDQDNSLMYVPPSLDSGFTDFGLGGGATGGGSGSVAAAASGLGGIAPSLDSGYDVDSGACDTTAFSPGGGDQAADSFVKEPPKLLKPKGLTGKISTLFRRDRGSSDGVISPASTARSGGSRGIRGRSRSKDRGRSRSKDRGRSSSVSEDLFRMSSSRTDHRSSEDADDEHTNMDAAAAVAKAAGSALAVRSASTASRGSAASVSSRSKRIFYSSNCDDDSDDSYESRISRATRNTSASAASRDRGAGSGGDDFPHSEVSTAAYTATTGGTAKTILRYRGFSTSIKSLFLDEALVCASMGCFGLILSNRTEYLLQIRNERRGTLSPKSRAAAGGADRRKLPSRIVAYGLIITILLMFSTFIIFGFGTGNGLASDYYEGYDYYDENDGNNNNNNYNANQQQGNNANDGNNNYNYNNNYNNVNQNNWKYGYDYSQYDNEGADAYDGYDGAQGDDAGQDNYDAYDAAGDDGGGEQRRRQQEEIVVPPLGMSSSGSRTAARHPAHGIFKLRDYQEQFWTPAYEFLRDEWYRGDYDGGVDRQRREEQSYTDDTTQQVEYTRSQRDLGSNIRMALLFAFLLFLGVLGRRRRMRTRFYLVRARAQEDHLYYASSDVTQKRVAFEDTRENQYEGACSHTLCGCYPVDEAVRPDQEEEEVKVSDVGIIKLKKKPHHEDSVARGFNCFMASCCGVLCKCWFQCLSICALAQEAREIRLLLPPRYQRIDFITHQPFHEYQTSVRDLRLGWMGKIERLNGFAPHYNALSRLSRYILVISTVALLALVLTLLFNPRAAFSWQDAVVLAATFAQSFLVLFFVHWIFHKSDLSLDAVIKLFAAGFLIAVPSAFFFEGLLVNIVLFSAWGVYEFFALCMGEQFTDFIFDHWRIVWIVGELFNAYVVAAITEELCKYYTFRAVEHPDLVFLTGLTRDQHDEDAVDGGLVKYPFGSHQVQVHNKDTIEEVASMRSYRSTDSRKSRSSRRSRTKEALLNVGSGIDDEDFKDDVQEVRSYRQMAMAITTGMISVAVGLACAENFLYVFVLGGAMANDNDAEEHHRGDVTEAWIVLFFRSIFPVHALAAAMQSINMIRKFVETSEDDGHRIGVGRIILPAVILHGTFDAVLMGINIFIEIAWDNYLEEHEGKIGEDQPYNAVVLNIVAWMSITGVMLAGIIWYFRENRKQRIRLKHLEDADMARRLAADPVGLSPIASSCASPKSAIRTTGTGTSGPSEFELV